MGNLDLKTNQIVSVPNSGKATNCGGMAMIGNDAFCVKTNGDENYGVYYKFQGIYNSFIGSTTKVATMPIYHGNGMTTNGNSLFIAATQVTTGSPKKRGIVKLSKDLKELTSYGDKLGIGLTSIAYYGSNDFIVKLDQFDDYRYIKYGHVSLTDSNVTMKSGTVPFYVENPEHANNYKKLQDIHYENGKLFVIVSHNTIKYNNLIQVYDINKSSSYTYNGAVLYKPIETLYLNKSKDDYLLYELESLDFDSDGNMVVSCNIKRNDDLQTANDSIIKITNYNLKRFN